MKKIKLAAIDSRIYNACDAPGYERGDMGKGKPKTARIYSVYRIDEKNRLAHCQSWDCRGGLFNESLPLHTLIPWKKK